MRRVIALAVCAAVPASASAGKYPKAVNCGTGEPVYTGWNYTELMAYGLSCRKATARPRSTFTTCRPRA
jgi:hypothetical protein